MSLIASFQLVTFYNREFDRLKTELLAFQTEEQLWQVRGDVNNSAGNLTLHLIGNLKHFFGAVLGNTGYLRNRDAEFATKDVPREELLAQLDETRLIVERVLQQLRDEDVLAVYPLPFFGEGTTTAFVLTQLHSHFNYHLGQISYLRRLGGYLQKMESDF